MVEGLPSRMAAAVRAMAGQSLGAGRREGGREAMEKINNQASLFSHFSHLVLVIPFGQMPLEASRQVSDVFVETSIWDIE